MRTPMEDRGVPPYRIAGDPHGSGSLGSGDGVNWEYVAWSREKLPLKIGGMACSFYTETIKKGLRRGDHHLEGQWRRG